MWEIANVSLVILFTSLSHFQDRQFHHQVHHHVVIVSSILWYITSRYPLSLSLHKPHSKHKSLMHVPHRTPAFYPKSAWFINQPVKTSMPLHHTLPSLRVSRAAFTSTFPRLLSSRSIILSVINSTHQRCISTSHQSCSTFIPFFPNLLSHATRCASPPASQHASNHIQFSLTTFFSLSYRL